MVVRAEVVSCLFKDSGVIYLYTYSTNLLETCLLMFKQFSSYIDNEIIHWCYKENSHWIQWMRNSVVWRLCTENLK